jgi:hypothetical protein
VFRLDERLATASEDSTAKVWNLISVFHNITILLDKGSFWLEE